MSNDTMSETMIPFPTLTKFILNFKINIDLVIKENIYESFNEIRKIIEMVQKDEDKAYAIRIFVFLDKVYEIRIYKLYDKFYVQNNINELGFSNISSYDVVIELYEVDTDEMSALIEQNITKFRNIKIIDNIEELLDHIRILLKIIKTIDYIEKEEKVEKEDIKKNNISKINLREIFIKLLNIDFSDITEKETYLDVVEKKGIVVYGHDDDYVIVEKLGHKNCIYRIILIDGPNYAVRCVSKPSQIEIGYLKRKIDKRLLVT